MIGLEWLGSLTSLVEFIGSLIPRHVQIPPTNRGVLYGGIFSKFSRVRVLMPGSYVHWPVRSAIHSYTVTPRVIELAKQYVNSRDGIPFWVDGSLQVSVYDHEDAVVRAFVKYEDTMDGIVTSEATNAISELINESLKEELYDRNEFNKQLTLLIRRRLRKYGVQTHKAYIATLVTGRPILVLGNCNE